MSLFYIFNLDTSFKQKKEFIELKQLSLSKINLK